MPGLVQTGPLRKISQARYGVPVIPDGGARASDLRAELAQRTDPDHAAALARFFQTGPGQYGEGDVFLGVRVPVLRAVAKTYADLDLVECRDLLDDVEHEHRFLALTIMTQAHRRALRPRTRDVERCAAIHDAYLDALRSGGVDNWDLVDASAPWLLGEHLRVQVGSSRLLAELVTSEDLWIRRAGLLGTFAYTRAGDPAPALAMVREVLADDRPLIQKASGWMLREVGLKVSVAVLLDFLDEHAGRMGRTALSYATEKIDPAERARLRALPR